MVIKLADWILSYIPTPIKSRLSDLKKKISKLYEISDEAPPITLKEKATNETFNTYTIEGRPRYDPLEYLNLTRPSVIKTMQDELKKNNGLKVKLILHCQMKKEKPCHW